MLSLLSGSGATSYCSLAHSFIQAHVQAQNSKRSTGNCPFQTGFMSSISPRVRSLSMFMSHLLDPLKACCQRNRHDDGHWIDNAGGDGDDDDDDDDDDE